MYAKNLKIFLLISTVVQCTYTKESNCKYSNEDIAANFDFNKLSQNGLDYKIKHEITNDTIRFQLCQPLNQTCAGQHSFACLTSGNVEKQFNAEPEMIFDDGTITFKYTGEKCQNDKYQSLNISMICDYNQKNSQPEISFYSQEECHILLTWRTAVACPNPNTLEKLPNCTVMDAFDNIYNLSSLKKPDNYVVSIGQNASIILNICQPVVYGYKTVCLDDSGACLRKESPKPSYQSIGVMRAPEFLGNNLIVKYDRGISCADSKSAEHMQTIISFTCDVTAYNTYPEYQGKDTCQYKFNWKTVAACSQKNLSSIAETTAGHCTIKNPMTNTTYDLNSLAVKDYSVVKGYNNTADRKIRICAPLSTNDCEPENNGGKNEAGVCLMDHKILGGKANSQLRWSHELGVYLNYTDGAVCQERRRYTIIKFICSRNNLDSSPEVTEDHSCDSMIQFKSSLVCEKEVCFQIFP